MKLAYQITRFGMGFDGRKRRLLGVVLTRLAVHLVRIHGPFTINGDGSYSRSEVVDELRNRYREHPNAEFKCVVAGSRYDESAWAVRSVAKLEKVSPLVAWVSQYVGRSSYGLGETGPPGPSDCSSTTMNAVRSVYKETLPHSAAQQATDDRIEHFHDPEDLRSGDFVFLNYGRLRWPEADHVEFWVGKRKGILWWRRWTIGSRPSTGGVNYYKWTDYDASRVVTYGRWR